MYSDLSPEQILSIYVDQAYEDDMETIEFKAKAEGLTLEEYVTKYDIVERLSSIDEELVALMLELDCDISKAEQDLSDYIILTRDEVASTVNNLLDQYADDAEEEIPVYLRPYFNRDDYLSDLSYDIDHGELIATYDGIERSQAVAGTIYYIYRINWTL